MPSRGETVTAPKGDILNPEQILQQGIVGLPTYALFATDANGIALTWNEGARSLLGYASEDFIGLNVDETFTSEDRARGLPARERAAADSAGLIHRATTGGLRWHMKRDGSRVWAESSLHAVRDDAGVVAGYTRVVRDASGEAELQSALDRSRAELEAKVEERTRALIEVAGELRRSERRFTQVFRLAPAAMVLATREDVLLDVNEAFEQMTGYSRDEVVGRNAKSMGFWGSPEDQRKLREARAPEKGFQSLELQVRTKEGEIRDILGSAVVVAIDEDVALVKMFQDVTERKENERHLTMALHAVMQDAGWLAQRVVEKLAQARVHDENGPAVSDLTPREREVLELVAQGWTNEEIADALGVSPTTVRNYVASIYGKTGVRSRAEAVVWARERGLGGNKIA